MTSRIERGEMLLLAVSRLHRLQTDELSKLATGVTLRQYRILQRIDEGYTSLSELSKLSHRSLPSTSESVQGLIQRGLLTRRVAAHDRRTASLGLTAKGRKALAEGTRCLDRIAEGFFGELSPTRQAALEALSRQMYAYAGRQMDWESVDGH